jgi:hypothetical protein
MRVVKAELGIMPTRGKLRWVIVWKDVAVVAK